MVDGFDESENLLASFIVQRTGWLVTEQNVRAFDNGTTNRGALLLPDPLESGRTAIKTELYPGRWTTHFVISALSDLDEELFDWIKQAYQFVQTK